MVSLRKVKRADIHRIFEWRNTPKIYEQSYDGRGVKAEEHGFWFEQLIHEWCGYIIIYKKIAVGLIYFHPFHEATEVSVYVDPKYWGKGIATKAIKKASESVQGQVVARILSTNDRSQKVFEKSGYSFLMGDGRVKVYTYDR